MLNLFLVLSDLFLIVKQSCLYFEHMLFIGVDKFSFLPLKHGVDLILKIVCVPIEIFDQLFYFLDIVLSKEVTTLYL